jgi:hypothetical protein
MREPTHAWHRACRSRRARGVDGCGRRRQEVDRTDRRVPEGGRLPAGRRKRLALPRGGEGGGLERARPCRRGRTRWACRGLPGLPGRRERRASRGSVGRTGLRGLRDPRVRKVPPVHRDPPGRRGHPARGSTRSRTSRGLRVPAPTGRPEPSTSRRMRATSSSFTAPAGALLRLRRLLRLLRLRRRPIS